MASALPNFHSFHKWDSKMKILHCALCTRHGRKIGLISFEMKARKARRAFEPSIPSIERAEPVSKCSDRSSFELRLGTRASLLTDTFNFSKKHPWDSSWLSTFPPEMFWRIFLLVLLRGDPQLKSFKKEILNVVRNMMLFC